MTGQINRAVSFNITKQAKELATFLAQLVREGVVYHISQTDDTITVELTGGF